MRIEDVIEGFNKFIEQNTTLKVHFVLQKSMQPDEKFKAYKTYTYTMWAITSSIKQPYVVIQRKDKVLTGQEDVMNTQMETDCIASILTIVYQIDKLEEWLNNEGITKH